MKANEDLHHNIDFAEQVETIEGIRRGIESMLAGQGRNADDFFAEMEDKYPFLRRGDDS